MQTQALTKAATGVTIDEDKATDALATRIVGELDEEAFIRAEDQALVGGITLPRVLRAKKQLRNAGLSDETIEAIGNDPENLEARLMEFSEAERGVVEGLPVDALVSTQMDTLLKGIEEGEIPLWARPAVATITQYMAQRGLSVSSVASESLVNAIIQSAMPIAQSNAAAIQQAFGQQRGIEAEAALQDAQAKQQTALSNASNVFKLNMAQFAADQETELSNSRFLQTVVLTDATHQQQAAIQEAASLASLDLATLDSNTKLAAQNAQAFLSMDMANFDRQQQAEFIKEQQFQQRLLSNQAALNAADQFNATSTDQTNQFMTNLGVQVAQFNEQRKDSMEQFNATQNNAAEARRVANEYEAAKLDAQLKSDISKFNAAQDLNRQQFNVSTATQIEQYNVKLRRDQNMFNTAAINEVNRKNAEQQFAMTAQAQAFMWQELRDQMDYSFKSYDNDAQRKASLLIAALGNEGASYEGDDWASNLEGITAILANFMNPG